MVLAAALAGRDVGRDGVGFGGFATLRQGGEDDRGGQRQQEGDAGRESSGESEGGLCAGLDLHGKGSGDGVAGSRCGHSATTCPIVAVAEMTPTELETEEAPPVPVPVAVTVTVVVVPGILVTT